MLDHPQTIHQIQCDVETTVCSPFSIGIDAKPKNTISNKMHSSTLILITCGIIAVLMTCSSASVIPPACSPSVLMTADAKYRQICSLLSQMARELEFSIDDRVPDMSELIDNGIKRKDVDHVFLRFGRPRM